MGTGFCGIVGEISGSDEGGKGSVINILIHGDSGVGGISKACGFCGVRGDGEVGVCEFSSADLAEIVLFLKIVRFFHTALDRNGGISEDFAFC